MNETHTDTPIYVQALDAAIEHIFATGQDDLLADIEEMDRNTTPADPISL